MTASTDTSFYSVFKLVSRRLSRKRGNWGCGGWGVRRGKERRGVPGSFCQLQNLDSLVLPLRPSLSPYLPPSPSRPCLRRRAGGRVEWRRALVCKDTLALRPLARRRTGKPRRWTKLLSDNLGRFSLGNSELALSRQRQCSGALSSPVVA